MSIATNGKVEIIIEMPNETGEINNETPSPASPQKINDVTGNPTQTKDKTSWMTVAAHHTMSLGKQALTSAISTIGISTGNYYAQAQAEKMYSAATQVTGLMVTAMLNPALAGVQIASMAINTGTELYKQNKEREIENYKTEQYAKRLGYTRDRR